MICDRARLRQSIHRRAIDERCSNARASASRTRILAADVRRVVDAFVPSSARSRAVVDAETPMRRVDACARATSSDDARTTADGRATDRAIGDESTEYARPTARWATNGPNTRDRPRDRRPTARSATDRPRDRPTDRGCGLSLESRTGRVMTRTVRPRAYIRARHRHRVVRVIRVIRAPNPRASRARSARRATATEGRRDGTR